MSLPPFWKEGSAKVHEVENVRFQSTLINPIAGSKQPASYPLVIWFCGLGPSGLDGIGVELVWLSRVTSKPFVLVAPIRSSTTWWVLDDSLPPWGCVIGSLLDSEVGKYCRWIKTLAGASGIDRTSVSLFGGSAGAYATSEVIASGTCELHCVGLAAVHGHGRPDFAGLDEECSKHSVEIRAKWTAYINRIRNHRTIPKILIGVHTEEDTFCPWKYAHDIYEAFDQGRKMWDLPPTKLVMVQPSKKRTSHNYGPQAMELFLQLAFGDAERSKRMLESLSSFCLPSSLPVSGRPASSSPAVVPIKADNVATVPRFPVGQDAPLPVGHFGRLTLGGGMQVLYIVHSDKLPQELWRCALDIGSSESMPKLEYFDSEGASALCECIWSAVCTPGSAFAGRLFMCTKVGALVAVGFGGNIKERKRSSRVAAAVCFELQAESPVGDFLRYPDLQSLIKQVRSCCNFDVR